MSLSPALKQYCTPFLVPSSKPSLVSSNSLQGTGAQAAMGFHATGLNFEVCCKSFKLYSLFLKHWSRDSSPMPPQDFKNSCHLNMSRTTNIFQAQHSLARCGFVCTALGIQLHSNGFALILQVWNYIITGRELHYLFSIDIVLIVKT
jgi:hypothetical protein